MSRWTYVTGVIEVDTCARSDAEAMYLAQTVVSHLPGITSFDRTDIARHPALMNLGNRAICMTISNSACSPRRKEF